MHLAVAWQTWHLLFLYACQLQYIVLIDFIYIIIYIKLYSNKINFCSLHTDYLILPNATFATPRQDLQKSRKYGSLGRKNFFPGQGEKKIIENILKIFGKIFGSMKNIY